MKISSIECGKAYNQTTEVDSKILPVERPFTSSKIKGSKKSFITPLAQGMAVAEEALKSVPDVREDIVASLKEKIQNGTYKVSSEEIADMMIRRLSADRIR
jgi:negative regulator of flagellin synthesis FlgM